MAEADAEKVPYHPFDLTKVWPKKDYPLIEVGVMELNRNPENCDAPEFIKRRHIGNCAKADPAYGAGVAKALGLDAGMGRFSSSVE